MNEPSYYSEVGNYTKNPLYNSANGNIYEELQPLKWKPGEVYNTTASGPSHIRSRSIRTNGYNRMIHPTKYPPPLPPPRKPSRQPSQQPSR